MQSAEMSALKMLRSGFFYLFVAMIMLIAFVEFAPTMFIYISSSAGIMEMIIFFTLLLLAIVVIFLYAIFEKIRYGMRQLSEVDSRFRICYTGTTLILVGLAILTLGTAIVVALSVEYTVLRSLVLVVEVLLIGGINAFIGYVLTFVVGAFKLHGKYRNPLYMATGILFVLDIFLPFIGGLLWLDAVSTTLIGLSITAVGYVLMYIALGGTIKKLNTQS
jgi:hypothetical protein